MKNKITLTIAGCSLSVTTSEPEDYVLALAEQLDEDVSRILSSSGMLSFSHAAILCALDNLSKYKKADLSASNMRDQIRDYLSDAASSKVELNEQIAKYNELFSEYEKLKSGKGIDTLSARCDELAASLARQIDLTAQAASAKAELEERNAALKQKLDDALRAVDAAAQQKDRAAEIGREAEKLAERNKELRSQYEQALDKCAKLQHQLDLLEQMIVEDAAERQNTEPRQTAPAPITQQVEQLPNETAFEPEPADDEPEPDEDSDGGEVQQVFEQTEIDFDETIIDSEPEPESEKTADIVEDAEAEPADIVVDPDPGRAVTSETQRQVEDLFSRLTAEKPQAANKPQPSLFDDAMPDLEWTKDI